MSNKFKKQYNELVEVAMDYLEDSLLWNLVVDKQKINGKKHIRIHPDFLDSFSEDKEYIEGQDFEYTEMVTNYREHTDDETVVVAIPKQKETEDDIWVSFLADWQMRTPI